MMYRVLLDTDPGIDDALAIFLGLASPELQFEGLTTVSGNVHVDLTTYNALALLEMAGRSDIAVARGSSQPLVRLALDAAHVHGSNGVGEFSLPEPQKNAIDLHAAAYIIDTVKKYPGEVILVAIGPLTNLALALRADPGIASAVREVVIMGGALRVPGNVTPSAEFNIFADPHAAHIVFHAGWPIRLVSLDVTQRARLFQDDFAEFRSANNAVATCITHMADYYFSRFAFPQGQNNFALHDPLSLAAVYRPDFLTWVPVYVDVELNGTLTFGETVAYFNTQSLPTPLEPNVQAAVDIDEKAFVRFFMERMRKYTIDV